MYEPDLGFRFQIDFFYQQCFAAKNFVFSIKAPASTNEFFAGLVAVRCQVDQRVVPEWAGADCDADSSFNIRMSCLHPTKSPRVVEDFRFAFLRLLIDCTLLIEW